MASRRSHAHVHGWVDLHSVHFARPHEQFAKTVGCRRHEPGNSFPVLAGHAVSGDRVAPDRQRAPSILLVVLPLQAVHPMVRPPQEQLTVNQVRGDVPCLLSARRTTRETRDRHRPPRRVRLQVVDQGSPSPGGSGRSSRTLDLIQPGAVQLVLRVRDSVAALALAFEESGRGVLVEDLVSKVVFLVESGISSVLGARGGKNSHQERNGARRLQLSKLGELRLGHVDRDSMSDRTERPPTIHGNHRIRATLTLESKLARLNEPASAGRVSISQAPERNSALPPPRQSWPLTHPRTGAHT